MRNKIYVSIASAIFLILFIWCPVSFVLDQTEILKIEDMANYKDPEKVYEDGEFLADILNSIERGKADLNNIYINYLPFYSDILKFVNSNDSYIQGEFVMMLYDMENPKVPAVTAKPVETPEQNIGETLENSDELNSIATEPAKETPPMRFIATKVNDAGMFRVYQVRSEDKSIGFLDISMAMKHDVAAKNMLGEQAHVNRIAAANKNVNFFVYIATRMQDTAYYNDIVSGEPSTKDIFDDFISGITGAAGIAWFDIDTLDKRLERCFLTDHHWNALGAYQAYTEVIGMMGKVIPDIGDPLPLKGLIEFPGIEYRGSGAARTQTPIYYDTFAVMDIDLPKQHAVQKVRSKLDDYLNGKYDNSRVKDIYISHYENFYDQPAIIAYPENNTGRRLLLLGDSYSYWVSWIIAAHFDKTFIHYTLYQEDLDYNKFIADNGITDVLLLQYSSRTLSKATSATKYLEQIITN